MPLTRRQFLKGASAAAVVASTHVLSFARPARAALGNRSLVMIHLSGGNDSLNTLVPLDNVGSPMRSLYESMRPDLAIPWNVLGPTGIGPDLMQGAKDAVSGMIDLLGKTHNMNAVDAYMLCSVCADLRISEIVDMPNWVVSLYFPRIIFD